MISWKNRYFGSELRRRVVLEVVHEVMGSGRGKLHIFSSIHYVKMMPPWLRKLIVFIYGYNQNSPMPFPMRSLPTKNQVKEKNLKFVRQVILFIILSKKLSFPLLLMQIVRDFGIGEGTLLSHNLENRNPRGGSTLMPISFSTIT